jgi:two-component system alkaline phosphatase synthesis response regulator PhoP
MGAQYVCVYTIYGISIYMAKGIIIWGRGSRMKIMVVDDDPDVIYVLENILSRYGCEVVGVTDSKKCVDTVKKEMPNLIFLDVMMPDITGWEICKKLKEDPATSGIFISMLTVRREDEDKKKSLEYAGANKHLCKPINLTEIKDVVDGMDGSELTLNP